MRRIRRDRKLSIVFIMATLVIGLTIGYAYLSTSLNINGSSTINNASWDIHFENINISDGSVTGDNVTKAATIDSDIAVSYNIRLKEPGDFYEFTVDVKNDGTIDGMIKTLSSKINGVAVSTLPNWLEYTFTYDDGAPIQNNHLLSAGDKETYKVRIKYRDDISANDLPSTNQTINATISVEIAQKDSNAITPVHYLKVGDYITLVPDLTTYTIPTSMSGHTSAQTINPRELTLWRVINKNNDGTYEVISEYASNPEIVFDSVIGFARIIDSLQIISTKYQKAGYTQNTRMFGYDGQTPIIEDTYYFDGSTSISPGHFVTPNPTTGVGQEYEGGLKGDTLYLRDYQLVSNVYLNYDNDGSYGNTGLKAYYTNGDTARYWVASRYYFDPDAQGYNFGVRRIDRYGELKSGTLRIYSKDDSCWFDSGLGTSYPSSYGSFRPILTLKSTIKTAGGSGTKANPYNVTNN